LLVKPKQLAKQIIKNIDGFLSTSAQMHIAPRILTI
jgi:hypothetical protein